MAISTIQNASLASGVPASANLPAGTILQVVNATCTGDTGTSSSSFSSSSLFATITPKFSTSKIFLLASSNCSYNATGQAIQCRIYRGTSGNGSGSSIGAQNYLWQSGSSSSAYTPVTLSFFDSPASTSALTYTIMQSSVNGGVAGFIYGYGANNLGSMTLMEIAA